MPLLSCMPASCLRVSLYVYVYVRICVYVCKYVYMYVCWYVGMSLCNVCMLLYLIKMRLLSVYLCMHLLLSVCHYNYFFVIRLCVLSLRVCASRPLIGILLLRTIPVEVDEFFESGELGGRRQVESLFTAKRPDAIVLHCLPLLIVLVKHRQRVGLTCRQRQHSFNIIFICFIIIIMVYIVIK